MNVVNENINFIAFSKTKKIITQQILENSGLSVGDDESVGGGVQVGQLHADLLVLQPGHGADLSHEEDDVAHVDVVAQAIEDEEQVGPVLHGTIDQRSRHGFFLLFFFFWLLSFLRFLLFNFSWSVAAFLAFN